jgi:RNA polymerase-binding transcription factor DksA
VREAFIKATSWRRMSNDPREPKAKPETPPAHGLTPAELAELRATLTARQKVLEARRARRGPEHETQADPMDAATDATTEAEELGLSAHDDQIRREIEHALRKFAPGTYGVSELSGRAIGYERLKLVPWARATVDEEERLAHQRR